MSWNPRTIIHDSFEVGIFIKGVDGVLQIVGAIGVGLIKPRHISDWIGFLTTHELSTDPHDWLANHLSHFAQTYTVHGQWFAAIYLITHGIVKIFLVYNLVKRKLWAYPVALLAFIAFGIYQTYRYVLTGSLAMLILTILDIAVIILTWLEYRQLKLSKFTN